METVTRTAVTNCSEKYTHTPTMHMYSPTTQSTSMEPLFDRGSPRPTRVIKRSHSASLMSSRSEYIINGRAIPQGSKSHPTTPTNRHALDAFTYVPCTPNRNQPTQARRATTAYSHNQQITEYCQNTSLAGIHLEPRVVKKWAEYTARRSVVKFRTRKSAGKRSSLSRRSVDVDTPCPKVNAILQHQYEKCRKPHSAFSDRLTAVLYCWYLGWILDVYSSLTGGSNGRSLWKWLVSCALVSMAAFLLVVLMATAVHGIVYFLSALGHAAVNFLLFVTGALVASISFLTAVSYFEKQLDECDAKFRHNQL